MAAKLIGKLKAEKRKLAFANQRGPEFPFYRSKKQKKKLKFIRNWTEFEIEPRKTI